MKTLFNNTLSTLASRLTQYTSAVNYTKRFIATMATAAMMTPALISGSAYADDWTMDAFSGCTTGLGKTTNYRSGLKAKDGTAVISCPITKKLGVGNLNWVYARIKRATVGGPISFCTLNSNSPYSSTSSKTTWGYASSTTNAQSIVMPLPTLYYLGYLNLVCVLNVNDILYGIRYGQD